MNIKKNAQVWVETAIYSLIGLTIIAILLTATIPQIDKIKDRTTITQTITALNLLDDKILEIQQSPGNIRIIYFRLPRGNLEINGVEDRITYVLEDTILEFSEPGLEFAEGNIMLKTEKYGRNFNILLTLNYSESINITYQGSDSNKFLQPGTEDYQIKIENPGNTAIGEKIHISFDIL